MTTVPEVSAVMPVFNPNLEFLAQALRSLLEQADVRLEVLVIEAGSPTTSRMGAEVADDRIKVLSIPRPSLIEQRNLALREAASELVGFLDSDDVARPDRFVTQARFLADHPRVAVVGSHIIIIDAGGRPIGSRLYPTTHEGIRRRFRRANALAGPSVMVRRKTLLDAGGFRNIGFGGMAEDYELWSRLALAGIPLANIDDYLTCYRLHQDSTKAQHTRDHLRATIEIKTRYWRAEMNVGDKLRLLAERFLLVLPPKLVYRAFAALRSKPPAGLEVPFKVAGVQGRRNR